MSIKNVFKSTLPHNTYLFKNGKAAVFVNGRFETDVADEITQLTDEITKGIPYLYVDPLDASVDSSLQDEIREAQIEAMQMVVARRAKAATAEAKKAADAVDAEDFSDPVVPVKTLADMTDTTGTNTAGGPISTDDTKQVPTEGQNPTNSLGAILAARAANSAQSNSGAGA